MLEESINVKVSSEAVINLINSRLINFSTRELSEADKTFLRGGNTSSSSNKVLPTQTSIGEFSDFWEWFAKTEKTLRHKKLLPLWNVGFVRGFVSKEESNKLLLDQNQEGTAIIRFSNQTKLGNCLVFSCLVSEKVTHILIRVEPDGFVLKGTLYNSIKDLLCHSTLNKINFIHPSFLWMKDFENAHLEVEKQNLVDQIVLHNPTENYEDEL